MSEYMPMDNTLPCITIVSALGSVRSAPSLVPVPAVPVAVRWARGGTMVILSMVGPWDLRWYTHQLLTHLNPIVTTLIPLVTAGLAHLPKGTLAKPLCAGHKLPLKLSRRERSPQR